jgi:hypothetical protein
VISRFLPSFTRPPRSTENQFRGATEASGRAGTRVRVAADLKCHLCGRLAGVIESSEYPRPKSVHFRTRDSSDPDLVRDWHRLRCMTCGGSLFVDAIEKLVVRSEPEVEELFRSERRRGHPAQESRGWARHGAN